MTRGVAKTLRHRRAGYTGLFVAIFLVFNSAILSVSCVSLKCPREVGGPQFTT